VGCDPSICYLYNDSSSADLANLGLPETRILISTTLLSEGLIFRTNALDQL